MFKSRAVEIEASQDAATIARFLASVERTEACWVWTRPTNNKSYGYISLRKRKVLAHRLAYLVWIGPIPDGFCVLHRCDNPKCVRPDHLFVGTLKDNAVDMAQKGRVGGNRNKTHCKRGHAFSGANLKFKRGGRYCALCYADYQREFRRRKRVVA